MSNETVRKKKLGQPGSADQSNGFSITVFLYFNALDQRCLVFILLTKKQD